MTVYILKSGYYVAFGRELFVWQMRFAPRWWQRTRKQGTQIARKEYYHRPAIVPGSEWADEIHASLSDPLEESNG